MILENGEIISINQEINVFTIKDIYNSYLNNYGYLKAFNDNVSGYSEALNFYNDNFSLLVQDEYFRKYIFALCTLKQDVFSSDREIVALMIAMSDYNVFLEE